MKTVFPFFILTILMLTTIRCKVAGQEDKTYSQSKIYFNINIPQEFLISCPYNLEDNTSDYANYEISYKDTLNYITISSYGLGRNSCSNIKECYTEQLLEWEETINITYKIQKDKWYVISGFGKSTGRKFYLKGYYGDKYYSKLNFVYPNDIESEFENFIPIISKSFKGK